MLRLNYEIRFFVFRKGAFAIISDVIHVIKYSCCTFGAPYTLMFEVDLKQIFNFLVYFTIRQTINSSKQRRSSKYILSRSFRPLCLGQNLTPLPPKIFV